jgi:hypothetical protein
MLTETSIKAAKPRERPYTLPDGRGLHLLVAPNGGRWWRLRYRFEGREKMLSLGIYPDVPLKQARDRREELRRAIASGKDPSAGRKAGKEASANTLEGIAEEFFQQQAKRLDPGTVKSELFRLSRRVHHLRGWSNGKVSQVFARGA